MNIAVLAGGTSTERDISIVTGTMVCKALRENGHNANVVDVFFGIEENRYKTDKDFFEENNNLDDEAAALKAKTSMVSEEVAHREKNGESFFGANVINLCKAADIVFMGLHGANGEDGKIQATFDLLGIKYTGTGYLSSGIAMNKNVAKSIIVEAGVPMPKGVMLNRNSYDQCCVSEVGYPCVVKPCCGGSSVGVSIANNDEEFKTAVDEAFALEEGILVEQYVKGREFSIGVIDNEAYPIIEIAPISGFYDYKNKYVAGMTKDTCPAEIPEDITKKMQNYAVEACKAIGLTTYGRVDFLLDDNNDIFCLEVNTLPGMTPTSLLPQEALAKGMDFAKLCELLVNVSMDKYNK